MSISQLRRLGYLALAIALALMLGVGFLSIQEWRGYDTVYAQATGSRRLMTLNRDAMDLVRDAETGQRGFLLTGKDEYLSPYNIAVERIPAVLRELAAHRPVSSEQAARIHELDLRTNDKVQELRHTIEVMRSGGQAAALAVVLTGEGHSLMDRIRTLSQEIESTEDQRRTAASNQIRVDARNIRIAVLLATLVLVGLVGAGRIVLKSATTKTENLLAELDQSKRGAERTRDLLRATLYSIGDGLIATDHAGAVQMMNAVAERLTGYRETGARGKDIEQVFHIVNEETRSAVENPVRRVMREGKVAGLANHTILISRTGQEIPIDDSGAPVAASGNTFSGVVLVFRDVSERKKAADTARRLAAIIEHSDDAIVGTTPDGVVTSWNRGAERLFGYAESEMAGCTISRIIPPEATEDMKLVFERIRNGETVKEYGTERIAKDGRRVNVSLTLSPIRNEAREVVGVSKIAHDVSHERQIEDHLRQMQKMEAVGRLAGGVAHDFNNLLTVILGYTTTLKAQLKPEDPLNRWTDEILGAATQAAAITGQLLTFSRKQVTEPRILDLNQEVLKMKDTLQRLIGEDVVLSVAVEAPPHPVRIDPGQLTQVLLNLAVNARDAMPNGGKLIIETHAAKRERQDLGLQGIHAQGVYSQLVVTDTGCGMDAETQAHIFEPFFTTKDTGRGTGLGLATVYGIVQDAGGWIEVQSSPNRGTTFVSYFPVPDGVSTVTAEPATAATAHRPATILLVEDQAAIRLLAEDVLMDAGHNVLSAPNGKAALELALEHTGEIDMLITDVVMPELSGPELAAQLSPSRPNMVVLYISGFSGQALADRGPAGQGAAFLQKPFLPDALLAKVDTLWGSRRPM